MKKFKISQILIFAIILTFGCEKDDFCALNPITPKLILRFYDDANQGNLKAVQRFSVIAQGVSDSLFINQTLDSIAIPLDVNFNQTTYTFKKNEVDGAITNNRESTITISYTISYEHVSRSCGFRAVFENLTISNNGWITNLTPSTITDINNQTQAHVQIFH